MRKTAQIYGMPRSRTAEAMPLAEKFSTPTLRESAGRKKARSAIAVILSRFPLITETFILREIEELERQGQPVRLVPLLSETPEVVHREAEAWIARALYTPFLSRPILASNLRVFRRAPLRYLSVLAQVLVGSAQSWNALTGTLGIFPKSVYLSERLAGEGVRHLHAHFATHPAMAAYIASRLSDMTFSFTAHAHDIFVHQVMLDEKIHQAAFVRCISRFNRDFLARTCGAFLNDKVHVVHCGVDAAVHQPPAERSHCDASSFDILCVAAFKHYKGLPVLVEACRRLKERGRAFRCVVIGDGPLRPEIERLIQSKGLGEDIRLLGHQPQHAVGDWMRRASVFVLPSIVAPDGQMEGIPVALMEAMACERPVIASSLSGIGELIDDGLNGLLVPPGDVEALTEAVMWIADNPTVARYMGRRGRRKILAEFQLGSCVAELRHLTDGFSSSVHAEVERMLSEVFELDHQDTLDFRTVHDGPDSQVWKAVLPDEDGGQELICKIHKSRPGQSRPPEERARREFLILSNLDALRRMANDRGVYRVPRPLRLIRERAAVVMEACRGTRLDLLLKRARFHPSRSLRAQSEKGVCRAALWLRTFQARTRRSRNGTEVLDALLERAGTDLERSVVSGHIGPEADRIRRRLRAGDNRVSLDLSSLCLHHGDFWPGNIFIDGRETTVVDFEGWREGLPLEDAAYLSLQLELAFPLPLLRRRGRRYAATFLEAYAGGEPFDMELYRLCRIAKALQILSQQYERSGSSFMQRLRAKVLLDACVCP